MPVMELNPRWERGETHVAIPRLSGAIRGTTLSDFTGQLSHEKLFFLLFRKRILHGNSRSINRFRRH